ncbi:MAG: thermonuclease family protein [Thiolinea sp.]
MSRLMRRYAWLLLVVLLAGFYLFRPAGWDGQPGKGSYRKLPEQHKPDISEYNKLLIKAQVISIADADTLTVSGNDGKHYRIRLQGIDAPEKKQAYGKACRTQLQTLANHQTVQVEAYKHDRYGRIVAKVLLHGEDVALQLIRQGCGWHYVAYADEQSGSDRRAYARAERSARSQHQGLWQDKQPQPPWEYRQHR